VRIPSGSTDRIIYFVAVDSTDLKTRETGLSSFTVYRSRNGGAPVIYTTPTISELSAANMPGVYALTIDEDTTIGSTHDTEEYCVHITQASMAPVTRVIELYRPETTEGNTIATSAAGRAEADLKLWLTVAPSALISGNVPSNVQAMAVDVITAAALDIGAGQEIADRWGARNIAGGSDGGRVNRDALRALRNKVDATLGIVYQEDDSTTAWTFVITTAAGNPVTIVDPA